MEDFFEIAGNKYRSRLIVGTGKYKDFAETKRAIEVSGAEIVTVAVRRVNITDPNKENLLDYLDPKKYTILPNTAGCYNAEDAVRTCRLARASTSVKTMRRAPLGRAWPPPGPGSSSDGERPRKGIRRIGDLRRWVLLVPLSRAVGETRLVGG